MNRREFLKGLAGAGAVLALRGCTRPGRWLNLSDASSNPHPNILFIMLDDLGWGDLGCFGHPVIRTPNLDHFAGNSCRCTDFYVPAPICSPTRAGCLTGRDPNRYGFKHVINTGMVNPNVKVPEIHHLPLSEPSLARLLRQAGYRTGTIGKWHLSLTGYDSEPQPRDYGFDHYFIHAGGGSLYRGPAQWDRNGIKTEVGPDTWFPKLYVDDAIDFIDQGGQPFYLQVWPFSPHVTEEAAAAYRDLYPGRTEHERTYFGCVTQIDEQLGRLFAHLRKTGLLEETIIIFTSDNGPEPPVNIFNHEQARQGSSGPFRGSKHVLYEGGIRVPGIIHWPDLTHPRQVCRTPLSVLDLVPTLCGVAGVPLPAGTKFDGADFHPALSGRPITRPHPLYWQCEYAMNTFMGPDYHSPPLALRMENWKLMCDLNFENCRLYNLDVDPGEQFTLDREFPERVKQMREQLKAVYADINGPESKRTDYLNPNLLGVSRK